MKEYIEGYSIVEGARDDESIFATPEHYEEWAEYTIRECKKQGVSVEVYSIYHPHPPEVNECACVQYLTDHSPDYAWDPDESEGE